MSPIKTFVDPLVDQSDCELFLGPFEDSDDPLIELKPEWTTMAHLLAEVGVFDSVGEAKRNGWNKPIPIGYEDIQVGKKMRARRIITLVKFD